MDKKISIQRLLNELECKKIFIDIAHNKNKFIDYHYLCYFNYCDNFVGIMAKIGNTTKKICAFKYDEKTDQWLCLNPERLEAFCLLNQPTDFIRYERLNNGDAKKNINIEKDVKLYEVKL